MFHCGDDLVGADLVLQTNEAANLLVLDLLIIRSPPTSFGTHN